MFCLLVGLSNFYGDLLGFIACFGFRAQDLQSFGFRVSGSGFI